MRRGGSSRCVSVCVRVCVCSFFSSECCVCLWAVCVRVHVCDACMCVFVVFVCVCMDLSMCVFMCVRVGGGCTAPQGARHFIFEVTTNVGGFSSCSMHIAVLFVPGCSCVIGLLYISCLLERVPPGTSISETWKQCFLLLAHSVLFLFYFFSGTASGVRDLLFQPTVFYTRFFLFPAGSL